MTTVAEIDTDKLPPTQYLVLEVLAARHRLGETTWSFPTSLERALLALQSAGLIATFGSTRPKTVRARLTDAGKSVALGSDYTPPNGGYDRLRRALEGIAEYAEQREDINVGMTAVKNAAHQALRGSAPNPPAVNRG